MRVGDIMERTRKTVLTTDDLESTLNAMKTEGLQAIAVSYPDGTLAGVVRRSRILEQLPDQHLDEALEETFPASDPISPARSD